MVFRKKSMLLRLVCAGVIAMGSMSLAATAIDEATIVYADGEYLITGDLKTNTLDTLYKVPGEYGYGQVNNAYISPDGKTIAARVKEHGQTPVLMIMNNDGSGAKTYEPDGWPSNQHDYWKDWYYTSAGIFWNKDGELKRFDIENETTTTLTQTGNATIQSTVWMSSDGRKGHSRRHILFTVSSDYSSAEFYDTEIKGCISGHGNAITADGGYICYNGFGHANLYVVPFTQQTLELIRSYDGSECPEEDVGMWSIPVEEMTGHDMANWFSPRQIVNSDTLVLMNSGLYSADRYRAIVNIMDSTITEVPGPSNSGYLGNGYVGALPDPDHSAPYMALDKNTLVFSLGDQTSSAAKDVIVTNSGTGTLGTIDAETDPASLDWLEVSFTGNGTNEITVTTTVDPSLLSDGEHTATVTLSGGGATNSVSYEVSVTTGAVLAPPSEVDAGITGDSMKTVPLNWTDNSGDEEGFAIERVDADSSWEEIARTAADETTYTDENVPLGTYKYRVRAFSGSRYSSYATMDNTVTVSGIAWVRVTSPAEGDVVPADSTYSIQWHTNKITNVRIFLEYGLEQIELTGTGGIEDVDANWGDYQWSVPDTQISNARIRVQQYGPPNTDAASGSFSINNTVQSVAVQNAVAKGVQGRVYEVFDLKGRLHVRIRTKERVSASMLKKDFSLKGIFIVREIPAYSTRETTRLNKRMIITQ